MESLPLVGSLLSNPKVLLRIRDRGLGIRNWGLGIREKEKTERGRNLFQYICSNSVSDFGSSRQKTWTIQNRLQPGSYRQLLISYVLHRPSN